VNGAVDDELVREVTLVVAITRLLNENDAVGAVLWRPLDLLALLASVFMADRVAPYAECWVGRVAFDVRNGAYACPS
jgi:hypothetical protein